MQLDVAPTQRQTGSIRAKGIISVGYIDPECIRTAWVVIADIHNILAGGAAASARTVNGGSTRNLAGLWALRSGAVKRRPPHEDDTRSMHFHGSARVDDRRGYEPVVDVLQMCKGGSIRPDARNDTKGCFSE